MRKGNYKMKLMVLDGNSIINRAFYGIRMLNAPDGTPTNGIYGFLTILQKTITEEAPDGVCVTFDLKGPTFRHESYAGYKAQRKAMPEELAVQMPILKEVLDAMGILRYECEGYEADDVIGTISRICEEKSVDCLVVTGDKDSFQLIGTHTQIRHVKSRMGKTETILYDAARFQEEYGFSPEKIVDLKALMGDASDNIPGVAGVGEKTAMDLILRFGTVEQIYANIDTLDIRDSVRNKLKAGEEMAKLSYELATICKEAPITFDPEESMHTLHYGNALYEWFQKLGFLRLIERWDISFEETEGHIVPEESETLLPCTTLETVDEIQRTAQAMYGKTIAIQYDEKAHMFTFCDGTRIYEMIHTPERADAIALFFTDAISKITYHGKDMLRSLLSFGYGAIEGICFDVALAAYLLVPTEANYALDRLVQVYLQKPVTGIAAIYALYPILKEKLEAQELYSVLMDIELPLCPVLASMEHIGFSVDQTALQEFGSLLQEQMQALTAEIWALAGEEFNINSPKQLGVILFDKLMLPHGKKTKTGWSTNAEVLDKLLGKHPMIAPLLEYRQVSKLKSTYADGLMKVIGEDGRIHTSFQMTVTATGRLSSTEPNLQNIPIRTPLGSEIRKMFVAGEDMVLVDADYSQIELRLLSHISEDERMQDAFLNGEDIHTVTASQVFGVALEEVTPLMRSRAKAVNFGIVYGISDFSLSQDIGVTRKEAKVYIENYLEKYHGVREYMQSVVEKAKQDGYVKTLYGRWRPMPELASSNYNIRSFGERVALNMPIQGTAADIIKLAMIGVYRRLKSEKLSARLLLQVHDELIVECPKQEEAIVKVLLKEEMERAAKLSVPLTADVHAGVSWHAAK